MGEELMASFLPGRSSHGPKEGYLAPVAGKRIVHEISTTLPGTRSKAKARLECDEGEWWIAWLKIPAAVRGRGHGTTILKNLLGYLQVLGAQEVHLIARPLVSRDFTRNRERLILWYRAMGFVSSEESEDYLIYRFDT